MKSNLTLGVAMVVFATVAAGCSNGGDTGNEAKPLSPRAAAHTAKPAATVAVPAAKDAAPAPAPVPDAKPKAK